MKRVLMVRSDCDGDVLLAGPAVRAVAAAGTRVTLLVSPRGRQAAHLLPGPADVIVHHCPWIDADPLPATREDMLTLVEQLAATRADEAIVLTSFHQSPLPMALLLRMAGVPRVGAISEDYPGSLLDVRHKVPDDVHEVERGLSLARAMGYDLPEDDDGRLRVKRTEPRLIVPRPYVVLHPGCSVPARAWAPERNADVAEALAAAGRRVVVTGGPGETDLTAGVAAAAGPSAVDLGGRTDMADLVEIIAAADAIVVGNTGPAHIAAAVGTPVVSIFPPTVPALRWRPWRVPQVLLGRQDIECAGCRSRACPVPGQPCIGEIPVTAVVEAVRSLTREAVAS